MQGSADRILTTHVGSLPRPPRLSELLIAREAGTPVDEAELAAQAQAAVREVVRRQVEAGVDIIGDGEQPRAGFQTYLTQRMRGFGGVSQRRRPSDFTSYPQFAQQMAARFPSRAKVSNAPMAVAEVAYEDLGPAIAECEMFEAAGAGAPCVDRFMTAASPGIVATTMLNQHYDSHEAYVFALARQLRKEYALIVARGFILQVDAPDLAMERTMMWQDATTAEFVAAAELHVAALNEALQGIPRDRVRLHCCWGNWDGPHDHDVALADVLPVLYQANVGGLSIELANPRHQHEYAALQAAPPPAHLTLLPGVVESTCNYVEHPEVVANRLCEAVAAVGDRERVIASCDCGFGTFAGYEYVAADVVWAKLAACAEGARRASARLWGR
jgi:5-methyltetrahydropteroyltriglutamate--homocysteine methyltransferase